jgi:hypothetical protein
MPPDHRCISPWRSSGENAGSKGNLIPPEAGVVLNTRPVKAAGCRSRATPAWPLGVTSTSRVDRRDDGSPPERRSGQGGACAARTVMTTRCPLSAGLPRSWPGSGWHPKRWARSGGNATGHDRGAGGRLGRVAGGQTVAEEPGVHLRHQRPVVFGQHPQHRLSSASTSSASRQGGRPRRPVRISMSALVGQERRVLTLQGGESPMPGSGFPVVPHDGGRNVAEPSARNAGERPCPAGRHWRRQQPGRGVAAAAAPAQAQGCRCSWWWSTTAA